MKRKKKIMTKVELKSKVKHKQVMTKVELKLSQQESLIFAVLYVDASLCPTPDRACPLDSPYVTLGLEFG